MEFFLPVCVFTLLTYPILNQINKRYSRKLYCIFEFLILAFYMGMRIPSTAGIDTLYVYVPTFERICNMSFMGVIDYFQKDIGFYIFSKIISLFTDNAQAYIFIISIIVVGAFSIFVYRYSKDCVLSYSLYIALGYYGTCFQMLRHALAVSILLFSYKYIKENRIVPFVIIVFLASAFHSSSLIFLIAYPFTRVKPGVKQWLVILGAIFSLLLMKNQLIHVLKLLLANSERYMAILAEDYSSAMGISGAFIILFIFIISYLLVSKKDTETYFYLNMGAISAALMFLVGIIGEFHRISMFFGMYNTLLLPYALKGTRKFNGRICQIICFAAEVVFLSYFLIFGINNAKINDYMFFWMR